MSGYSILIYISSVLLALVLIVLDLYSIKISCPIELDLDVFFSGIKKGKTVARALYESGSLRTKSMILSGKIPGTSDLPCLSKRLETDAQALVADLILEEYRTDPIMTSKYLDVLREAAAEVESVRRKLAVLLRTISVRAIIVLFVAGLSLNASMTLSLMLSLAQGRNTVSVLYSVVVLVYIYVLSLKIMPKTFERQLTVAASLLLGYGLGGILMESLTRIMVNILGF